MTNFNLWQKKKNLKRSLTGSSDLRMRTTNENERILANLGKNEQNRNCPFLPIFCPFSGKKWAKTGERNQTLAKQGKTESFAEFWFGIATPWSLTLKLPGEGQMALPLNLNDKNIPNADFS